MARGIPQDVAAAAIELPPPFAPLREYLASGAEHRGGWVPVLELPPVDEVPATLQWLPRARTPEEVNSDLRRAFTAASAPAKELAEALGELPLAVPPQEMDWHWWIHELGQNRGTEELELTLPGGVSIVATGGDDADFALFVQDGTRVVELAHTGDDDVLEYLSSGQRRWVDEALATVARELALFGHRAALHADQFYGLHEDTVMAAVLSVANRADGSILEGDFWTGETFDLLLCALEPSLVAAETALANEDSDVVMREMTVDLTPGLSLLQSQLVVRVFDEPEAHLHPTAQRATASALDRLRLRGENIVLASHSPHFLDIPGWSQVHVQPGVDGAELAVVPHAAVSARTELAHQLGVNRGELLAGINAVLLVEGAHDQLILKALFGAQLRAAGIAIVRMHGTNNLLATAELDFLDQYLDVPIVVLLDYTRVKRIGKGKPVSDEETKLLELQRSLRRRRRRYDLVGLERPDIICYLSEAAVREVFPDFPGWSTVLARFSRLRGRPSFKPWLEQRFGVDLSNEGRIRTVLAHMGPGGHGPVGELTRKVNEILSCVDDRTRQAPLQP
jgi:hypothetical protein